MNRELYMEFFQISVNTFYLWKKQKRPVIEFFSKYSTDDEIKEFIKTGKINRIEKLNSLFNETILKYLLVYIDSFTKNSRYISLSMAYNIFIDFYFQFLCELKNNVNLHKDDFNALLYSELHKYVFKKYIHNSSAENVKKRLLELEQIDNKISRKEMLHVITLESENDFFRLQNHFSYFKHWDEGMVLFLDFILKNNFKFLLNRGKELLLHTIGLNVYLETSELDLHYTEKLNMVIKIKKELLNNYEENEISLEKILEYIEKYKNDFLR
jgi:hypothetical protein